MAVLDARETYQNLKNKGFEDAVNKSDDHRYLKFFHEGKAVLTTKLSHGGKDIGDFLISMMSRQCQLNKKQFVDLAKCPLSEEEYVVILQEKGFI